VRSLAALLLCIAASAGEAGLPAPASAAIEGEVLHANTLEFLGLNFRDVVAKPVYTAGSLQFNDLEAKAYRGRVSGSYAIDLTGDRRSHRCNFEFIGLDLATLARSLGATNEQLGGRVDGWLTLDIPVGDPARMKGRGEIRISEGTLVQLPLLVSFLAGNPSAARGKDSLIARFEMRGGSVRLLWAQVESQAVRLLAQGRISYDGRLEIEISPRLPFAVIDRVPLLGGLMASGLSRLTGNVTRAYVRGHVSQPVIVVNALGK
jgi:hypothetical protein